ncbi:EamA domain-containing membrane protein RarD [Nocardioides terrae]|uniref:EamA domain-containing membrane protein RarD n=1 Tax=Nocardioides terrae TaxID=574651 RepID=A0A1I1EDA9_9ACTN|nr:DMT family transporter [Nocardioides terrae]SFB85047.1 EamA domain-containing membrane protein RarD [Nocardioides terrae]
MTTDQTVLTKTWLPVAAVSTTLVLWASAFVAIRHLSDVFHPGAMALGRMLVGAACLSVVALRRRPLPRPSGAEWRVIAAIGVLWYAVYMLALNAGERLVDAGTASMILQLSPIVIAVLAAVFLGEAFTAQLGVGLALAFAGVAIIGFASSDSADGGRSVAGVLLCLIPVAAYSVSLILQKPIATRFAAVHLTWLACSIGAVVTLPWIGQLVGDLRDASAAEIGWLAYLGVFPTAIAFTTYGYALQHISASRLGISTYVVPVISIALAWVFLSETPPALAYVGGVVALLGVAITRSRRRAAS